MVYGRVGADDELRDPMVTSLAHAEHDELNHILREPSGHREHYEQHDRRLEVDLIRRTDLLAGS